MYDYILTVSLIACTHLHCIYFAPICRILAYILMLPVLNTTLNEDYSILGVNKGGHLTLVFREHITNCCDNVLQLKTNKPNSFCIQPLPSLTNVNNALLCHHMQTFSALLAPLWGESTCDQRAPSPAMRSSIVAGDLRCLTAHLISLKWHNYAVVM